MTATTIPGDPVTQRIRALDLARAIAILGMVIVNFELALQASSSGPGWLARLTGSLQGRAAGTFVILAGIGATLGSARARAANDRDSRWKARNRLLKRSAFLFVLGTALMSIWPADILHFYGAWLLVGAALLFARNRTLVLAILSFASIGVLFLALGKWSVRWDFSTLSYRDLWTPTGYLRNLFLDGWHPVFPWCSLYLLGMLVGRAPIDSRSWRRRTGISALAALVLVEASSAILAPRGIETEGIGALFATSSFPPTPAYLIAASATALLVIVLCGELRARSQARWLRVFEASGRLALTIYVAHVVIGLGTLEALGALEGRALSYAVTAALIFCAASIAFSWLWLRRFRFGPLESLMRSVCEATTRT